MDIFDNAINKRIMGGSFPTDKLYSASIESDREIDFTGQAKEGLAVLSQNPDFFYVLFCFFRNKARELDSINRPEGYQQEINYLINARCSDDFLLVNGSLQDAYNLCPVVTPLDKVLWFGAYAYSMEIALNPEASISEAKSMMFAWIHLLSLAQSMEFKTGRTIRTEAVKPTTRLFDILSGIYEERGLRSCIRKVTSKEANDLGDLFDQREELLSKIREEQNAGRTIAAETETNWEVFLQIINDLSEKESHVVETIIGSGSAKDKIRVIQDYNYTVDGIEKGRYTLNGEEIRLIPIFEGVNERIQRASTFACAHIGDGRAFRVTPALFALAMDPKTYNYCFITFQHFRLAPSKETAKRFLSLALSCLKRNLGGEKQEWFSLSEMIEDFYSTVSEFMKENRHIIDRLSFDKLLTNSVAVEGMSFDAVETTELHRESMAGKIKEYISSGAYDKDIISLVQGKTKPLGLEALMAQVGDVESEMSEIENEATAKRIIISLNIIYMFCDALRIMLSNKHGNIKIKNRNTVEIIRRELLSLDDELVHTVYAHLGDQEIGMLEYREKSGVFSFTLSEQEAQEETFRNMTFSDILKGSIERLVEGIENQNADQIMSTNSQIRSEIMRYPDCDEKDYYATWLDSICGRICAALIENCKKQKDDYQSIKQTILSSLGPKSGILPQSTIDSLTTAEMLYARYASDEYANEGFDFSCISALYYQAFEEAYNDLIWHGYSAFLNNLVIQGIKYTDILDTYKGTGIANRAAWGYLDDQNSYQRGFYIKYRGRNNPQTYVDHRCMYKSFGIIMESIDNPSKLVGFCEYFAKRVGFASRADMFQDQAFMQKCKDFTSDIIQTADNRNNASHGGSFISLSQCSDDKRIVLNNLELVRSSSIGLIQQLLYVLQKD